MKTSKADELRKNLGNTTEIDITTNEFFTDENLKNTVFTLKEIELNFTCQCGHNNHIWWIAKIFSRGFTWNIASCPICDKLINLESI